MQLGCCVVVLIIIMVTFMKKCATASDMQQVAVM